MKKAFLESFVAGATGEVEAMSLIHEPARWKNRCHAGDEQQGRFAHQAYVTG